MSWIEADFLLFHILDFLLYFFWSQCYITEEGAILISVLRGNTCLLGCKSALSWSLLYDLFFHLKIKIIKLAGIRHINESLAEQIDSTNLFLNEVWYKALIKPTLHINILKHMNNYNKKDSSYHMLSTFGDFIIWLCTNTLPKIECL